MTPREVAVLSGGPFTPASLPGRLMHFDANNLASMFTDSAFTTPVANDADAVGGMRDLAGLHDVIQATAANKPTYKVNIQNGLPVLRLAGTVGNSSHLATSAFTNPDSCTIFAVCQSDGLTYNDTPLGAQVGGTELFTLSIASGASATITAFYTGSTSVGDSQAATTTNWNVWSATIDPYIDPTFLQAQLWANGTSASATSTNPTAAAWKAVSRAWIVGDRNAGGTSDRFGGDIGEIVVYSRVLTPGDRRRVEAYLGKKWGITVS